MSDITVGSVWVCMGLDIEVTSIAIRDDRQIIVSYQYLTSKEKGQAFISDFLKVMTLKEQAPKAVQILNEAVAIMAERGKSYDKSGGEAERSMPKIVAMFNALTGHELTPEQGWKFMCCLKLARSEQGEYREDNYLDGAAYMALAGEEAEASSE